MSFVNIVGRDLDVPVVNLGFSGSGVMELEMSDHLARIDASCYVLDCLWNMGTTTGDRAINANGFIAGRNVEENYEPFIRNLRAKRPDVPIVMAAQCDVQCGQPNVKDRFVKELYDRLVAEGWKNLVYLPKDGMYSGDNEGTVDGCHPNDYGMMSLAKAFGWAVAEALGLPGVTGR
jgi:lysophospholipase L1-like esterase